jgi:hypothetical protein
MERFVRCLTKAVYVFSAGECGAYLKPNVKIVKKSFANLVT